MTYTPGDIDGQNGWAGTGGGNIENTFDQTVVDNTSAPGLLLRAVVAVLELGDEWRVRQPALQPIRRRGRGDGGARAGGSPVGAAATSFVAEWDFASAQPGAEQPGLGITAAPTGATVPA